ncbi:MAG TPA: iron-sulfur cluster repair di-iron protein [Alphaproteobacteria bacterium]|nr:iron-sulfur cluster repair di-iron protein [Alphaproteobacteria bacterium]
MMNALEHSTVSEIAATYPDSYRIFHKYGIDFCCGGKRKLSDVCAEKSIEPRAVLGDIAALAATADNTTDWQKKPLAELVEHIISTHHAFLRQELPRLHALCAKVARRHGEDHPYLLQVFEEYCIMSEELRQHIEKEENILFPVIVALGRGGAAALDISCPIEMMEHEHEETGAHLEKISALTHGYKMDDSYMCASFKALYTGLADLENDIKLHIHKENNILFPRALALLGR